MIHVQSGKWVLCTGVPAVIEKRLKQSRQVNSPGRVVILMLDWCSHNADRPGRSANGRVRGTQGTSLRQRSAAAISPRSMGRGRVSWCARRHMLDFYPQTADPVFTHWIVNTTDAALFNGPAM